MSLPDHESDLLRQMVRQVLQEIVPQTMAAAPAPDGETVAVASDADLQAFARRIARAPQAEREAIVAGTRSFRLAGPAVSGPVPTGSSAPVVRVEKGAVTERHVREAVAQGAALVLGPRAVLTPLARDRARASGVEITREK